MSDELCDYLRDMDGKPISMLEWAILYEDFPARLIADTEVVLPDGEPATVRTIWSGHRHPEIRVWPFGTAVGRENDWHELGQWETKQDALDGHAGIVAELNAGVVPSPSYPQQGA